MSNSNHKRFIDNWISNNDSSLTEKENEKWVCVRVLGGNELNIAYKLKRKNIPFFIPLVLIEDKYSPLIKGYIFCRVSSHTRQYVNTISIRIIDTKGEKSYLNFFNQINSLSALYETDKKFQSGQEVILESGMRANVIEEINDTSQLIVNLKLFKRNVKATVKKQNVKKVYKSKSDMIFIEKEIIPIQEKTPTKDESKKLEKVIIQFDEINKELINYLSKKPDDIFKLNPYKYEELVAKLLEDMGYDVYLTPKSKDGGRDILAVIKIPPNKEILTIVECKQHSPKNKIGQAIVERFLFTIMQNDKSNRGLIATTSTFTKDAKLIQDNYKWILDLYNHTDITEWLKNYGTWTIDKKTGLWIPKTDIIQENKIWT